MRVAQQASQKTYGSEGETEREVESSPEYVLQEQQEEALDRWLRGAAGPKQRECTHAAEQGEPSVSVRERESSKAVNICCSF